MFRRLMVLALITLALVVVSVTGYAQYAGFKRAGLDLSDKDLDLLRQAAAKLYESKTAMAGDIERWTNPKSGNAGTVELIGTFETDYQGKTLPCAKLLHDVTVKGVADPFKVTVSRCELEDGVWKVL